MDLMHILMLPSWYGNKINPNSGKNLVKDQAKYIAAAGHKVGIIYAQSITLRTLLRIKGIRKKSWVENGIRTILLFFPRTQRFPKLSYWLDTYMRKRLFKIYIRKHGHPNIIHIQSMLRTSALVLWIKEKYHIPYIITERCTEFKNQNIDKTQLETMKKVVKNSYRNFAVSKPFAKLLQNIFGERFLPFYNIINYNFFIPSKSTPFQSKDHFIFLNVAFAKERKNKIALLKAFAKLFRGKEYFKLILVGGGPENSKIRHEISTLNIQSQVSLVVTITQEEVRNLMQQCDVFVLPSLYETFGGVVIEAMSCGKPVIITHETGIKEYINEKIGTICDTDEASIAQALLKMAKTAHLYDPSFIRQYTMQKFSQHDFVDRMVATYREALNDGKR